MTRTGTGMCMGEKFRFRFAWIKRPEQQLLEAVSATTKARPYIRSDTDLSYTTFSYSGLTIPKKPINADDLLATSRLEAQMLAKELQHVILKTISNLARVSSLVLVKGVRDSILNKHVMQFGCFAS